MAVTTLWLLVGLGNPGASYAKNRHNVGFMALDAIADALGAPAFQEKKTAAATSVDIKLDGQTHRLVLLKPLTYMNRSGPPVAEVARFYKIPPRRILVFHDELALKTAKVKVKWGGGHAGHNGLKSLDAHVGKDYGRIRIGIDHPGIADAVTPYVLGNFRSEERTAIDALLERIARDLPTLLESITQAGEATLPSDVAGPFLTQIAL